MSKSVVVRPRRAPVVMTPRLILRAHNESDLDASAAMWADPMVTRYIGGKPSTRDQTWSRILGYAGLWSMLGFGYWAIFNREDDAFIGEVGFADFKRSVSTRFDMTPEMGWVLASTAHGKGYAREATAAALAWALGHLQHSKMVCMITPENVRSVRIAVQLGFQEYTRTSYRGADVALFERATLVR